MNEYEIAGVIGGALALAWVAGLIFSRGGQRAWAWVDDAKAAKNNPLLVFVAKCFGYECDGSSYHQYRHHTRRDSLGADIFFWWPMLALAALPMTLLVMLNLYPITLMAAGAYLMAQLARYSRRHKKAFDKHVDDKVAHG